MLKRSCLFILTLLACVQLFGQNGFPERQEPAQLVNNFSKEFPDFLSKDQQAKLEQKLQGFSVQTSNQIAIVVVDDLSGMEAAEYAQQLANLWGIGQAKLNNGILILVKPTGGAGERKYYIAIGSGLEAVIPDATVQKICDEELIPYFKKGNFYEGLDKTTDVLMALAKSAYDNPNYNPEKSKK